MIAMGNITRSVKRVASEGKSLGTTLRVLCVGVMRGEGWGCRRISLYAVELVSRLIHIYSG